MVSIIIPCFNSARFVGQAIESALAQTYTNLEIVVVDDGSTDSSRDVIGSFDDQRMRYVYQENKGLAASRNTGIRLATGHFLTFLDADDKILPDKIEIQVAAAKVNPDVGLIYTDFCYFSENELHQSVRPERRSQSGDMFVDLLGGSTLIVVHAPLTRRKWIDQAGGFDESLTALEDWDLWLRLSYTGCPFFYIDQPLALYRMTQGSMSSDQLRMSLNRVRVLEKLKDHILAPTDRGQYNLDDRLWKECFQTACLAYSRNQASLGRAMLAKAHDMHPSSFVRRHEWLILLAEHLVGQEEGQQSPFQSEAVVNDVLENLPQAVVIQDGFRRKALARLAEVRAFQAYQSRDLKAVWLQVFRVFLLDPLRLFHNRGLLSICFPWRTLSRKGYH